jgi:ubiquitin-protein ligase
VSLASVVQSCWPLLLGYWLRRCRAIEQGRLPCESHLPPSCHNSDANVFKKRKEHPNLRDTFVELVPAYRRGLDPANRVGSNLRSSRLLSEIQSIAANPHPHMDVYVSERDMSFWKIVMQGPPDSVYAGGTFVLYLDMEDSYPTFAPKCRFVTSIYHPNVNKHGRICHSIFDRNWTSDTTSSMVMSTVYGLLLVPDYSDPV